MVSKIKIMVAFLVATNTIFLLHKIQSFMHKTTLKLPHKKLHLPMHLFPKQKCSSSEELFPEVLKIFFLIYLQLYASMSYEC